MQLSSFFDYLCTAKLAVVCVYFSSMYIHIKQ